MWTRFIWGGEHHVDEVHLGRRGREVHSLSKKDLCDSFLCWLVMMCCEVMSQLRTSYVHHLYTES